MDCGIVLAVVLGMAIPAGVESQAVASPRKTPVRRGDPKPYQVGKEDWYGEEFHGRVTASGEQFDMFGLTAAHRRLPLGTRVRVTHLRSRRSVVVRITDRGPADSRSILDLSYGAAKQLGVTKHGVFLVRLDLVKGPTEQNQSPGLVAQSNSTNE